VTFTPQASGSTSATLAFVSNASNSPTQQTATGSGVPAPQHSVGLSWNASNSQGVVGYNVYRGGVSGGPYSQINTSLDGSMNYTDTQVVAGQTYYYVTTAVDGSGMESAYSNEAQAVIPSP
jgi:fibronectin type 3 domain-containing protein